MATGKTFKESLSFTRVLQEAYDTICEKIDLQQVGARLISKESQDGLPKQLVKKVKLAVKKKDKKMFYLVLNKFDMKSFAFFLEVLDSIEDEPHTEILRILCHNIQRLPVADKIAMTRLQPLIEKHAMSIKTVTKHSPATTEHSAITATTEQSTSTMQPVTQTTIIEPPATTEQPASTMQPVTQTTIIEPPATTEQPITTEQPRQLATIDVDFTDLLNYTHPVETTTFSKKNEQNVLYSPSHDVKVTFNSKGFPKNLDQFSMSLTVNDYSNRISIPPDYNEIYSALISLKCDPAIQKFQDYVTIQLPHCAVGDVKMHLCVLSAADGDKEFHKDPDIKIDSIDEYYLTFRTMHFTSFLLSSLGALQGFLTYIPQQISGYMMPPLRRAVSAGAQYLSATPQAVVRSLSSPATTESINKVFSIFKFAPSDTSSFMWRVVFVVTPSLPTHAKELEAYAASFDSKTKAEFTFSGSYIELYPLMDIKYGWKIDSDVSPAEIWRESVSYWYLPQEERSEAYIPKQEFVITRIPGHGALEQTSLTIKLKGSNSLVRREPILFNIFCSFQPPQPPPPTQPMQPPPPKKIATTQKQKQPHKNKIKIIREMYSHNSRFAPILEGSANSINSSNILLHMDDRNCCTLLCEISFHLYHWEKLGQHLNMDETYIESLKMRHCQHRFQFRPAFEMLVEWVSKYDSMGPPNLWTLVCALGNIGYTLVPSTWSTNYAGVTPGVINEKFVAVLAPLIQYHWEFVGRLLGETETDIDSARIYNQHNCGWTDQACSMLSGWRRHSGDYWKLFDSIHCLHEHLNNEHLKNALHIMTRQLL